MTRINLVPPKELGVKHLVGEHYELPRVFNLVRRAQERGETPATVGIPSDYVLGAGHLKFFYNKLRFLERRYGLLKGEMQYRGYVAADPPVGLLEGIDEHWLGDYEPTPLALYLNRLRIKERSVATEAMVDPSE